MIGPEDEGRAIDALRFSLASDIVELVVLTGDDIFLQTLREAVGPPRRLWHVPSADKVSDLLRRTSDDVSPQTTREQPWAS